MKKGDLINTELISVANVFECTNIKYKTRNILVLVAGPGSDGSYMLDMAKNSEHKGWAHFYSNF